MHEAIDLLLQLRVEALRVPGVVPILPVEVAACVQGRRDERLPEVRCESLVGDVRLRSRVVEDEPEVDGQVSAVRLLDPRQRVTADPVCRLKNSDLPPALRENPRGTQPAGARAYDGNGQGGVVVDSEAGRGDVDVVEAHEEDEEGEGPQGDRYRDDPPLPSQPALRCAAGLSPLVAAERAAREAHDEQEEDEEEDVHPEVQLKLPQHGHHDEAEEARRPQQREAQECRRRDVECQLLSALRRVQPGLAPALHVASQVLALHVLHVALLPSPQLGGRAWGRRRQHSQDGQGGGVNGGRARRP
mmetsp:Transcript_1075/g.3863  ORF Transcript_1075/g.3863 Transcript_1075/m.3863 type:complete len:302 (-) Transcript_1075:1-906(-)